MQPRLTQLNLAVRDMHATVRFYELLGLVIQSAPDGRHASAPLGNGITIEFDTTDFVPEWDAGWRGITGGGAVIGFTVPERADVDRLYAALTKAGHTAHQPPYDAFWGARYAIVEDPDGHPVGLMSPIEDELKFWPPAAPPALA
jgi:uncharacterized glyoxalase superfamily protein PhnB